MKLCNKKWIVRGWVLAALLVLLHDASEMIEVHAEAEESLRDEDASNPRDHRRAQADELILNWRDRSYNNQTAIDIGCGDSLGLTYITGTEDKYFGGYIYYNYRHLTDRWRKIFGQAERIALGSHGKELWVVNKRGDVYLRKLQDKVWRKKLSKFASDIGVNGNGKVFIIGRENKKFGSYIYELTDSGLEKYPGQAVRVAVDQDGNPWVINSMGMIWSWSNGKWHHEHGPYATDIAIGVYDNTVMITGGKYVHAHKGYQVYEYAGYNAERWDKWSLLENYGYGTAICLYHRGDVSVVRSDGKIYSAHYSFSD